VTARKLRIEAADLLERFALEGEFRVNGAPLPKKVTILSLRAATAP